MAFDAAKARELMDAEKTKREQAAAAANPEAEQETTWMQDRMDELNTEIADSTPEETYTFDPEESRAQFNAIGDLVSNTAHNIDEALSQPGIHADESGEYYGGEESWEARRNLALSPVKEAARQFIPYADDKNSAFQDIAQGIRQSSANIEYFMTDEEKLETARKINQRLPMIPGGAMLASTEAMQGAMFAYDMAEKMDAVGGNMESVYRQIPILRTISADDPIGAALALKDIKHVFQAKNVFDSFRYGWEHGNANYEYGLLKMKEAFEGLTDDERDEAEKLERTLRQTEQYYPSFFVDPLLAMASGVESLPEMIYTTAKSIPYGIAGAGVGAALAGVPTYGAGVPAGAATGFTWGRRAGLAYEMFKPMMGRKFAEYQAMTDENGAPLMTREQARNLATMEAIPEAAIEMGAFELGIWKNLTGSQFAKQAVQDVFQYGKNAIAARSFADVAKGIGKDLTIGSLREMLSESGEEFLQTYPDAIANAYIENAKNVSASDVEVPKSDMSEITQDQRNKNFDISLSRLSDTMENLDWGDVTKKAVAQAAAAAPGSLMLGILSGGVGIPVSGVRYSVENSAWMRQWGEMAKTERTTLSGAIMLDQLQATVQDSKLKDAAPDVQREIIRDQAKDTPWQMAYVDVATALESENGEEDVREVGRAAGKSDAEIEAAIAQRGTLAVPIECYAQSKASPKLLDSVSFSEDAEPLAVMRKNAANVSEAYNRRMAQEVKKQVELTEAMTNELFPDSGEERDAALAAIYQNPENPAQGWKELYDNATAELDEIIAPAVAALESGMGQGTSVVDTVNEIGEVSSGRVSNNAEWYREWYKEHKRPPTQQEKRDMAKLMVMGDVNAPQVQGWRPTSGEEAAAMESMRARITALDNEINTLNSIKDRMQTLNGTEMQLTAGLSPEAYKVYRTINSSLRGIGGKQARAARIGALITARHADVISKRMQRLGNKDYTPMSYLQQLAIQRGMMGASEAQEAYNQQVVNQQMEEVRRQYEGTDQWMKAPNGQPTKLTEEQWLIVRTPAFKNWFGDWENDPENASKVVDENGEPLATYHGTKRGLLDSRFTAFDGNGRPVWHSASEDYAGIYANNKKWYETGDIYADFLNIKNPINVGEVGFGGTGSVNDLAKILGVPFEEVAQIFDVKDTNKKTANLPYSYIYQAIHSPEFVEWAKGKGYDGIIEIENSSRTFGTFEPTQIKSATGNNGQFLVDDPNIYHQITNLDLDLDARVLPVNLTGVASLKTKKSTIKSYITGLVEKDFNMPVANGKAIISVLEKDIKHLTYSSKRSLDRKQNRAKNASILSLSDLLKDAVFVETAPNKKPDKKPHVLYYHRFYVPVRVGNDVYTVRLVAEEQKDVFTFNPTAINLYDVIVEDKESSATQPSQKDGALVADDSTISIRELLTNVNDYYGNPYIDQSGMGNYVDVFKQAASSARDLIAYHNTTEDALSQTVADGIAMPSLAITKKDIPFDNFGGITLIGNQNLIDPARGTDVYSRDAYTTRIPRPEYAQPTKKQLADFEKEWTEKLKDIPGGEELVAKLLSDAQYYPENIEPNLKYSPELEYYYLTRIKGKDVTLFHPRPAYGNRLLAMGPRDVLKVLESDATPDAKRKKLKTPILKLLSLRIDLLRDGIDQREKRKENGGPSALLDKANERDRSRIEETQKQIADIKKKGISEELYRELQSDFDRVAEAEKNSDVIDWNRTRENLDKESKNIIHGKEYQKFVASLDRNLRGEARVKVGRKYYPYTTENIVKAMLSNRGSGQEEGVSYTTSRVAAVGSKKFRSLDELRKSKESLASEDEVKKVISDVDQDIYDRFEDARQYHKNLRPDDYSLPDIFNEAIAKAIKGGKTATTATVKSALRSMDFDVEKMPDKLIADIVNASNHIKDAATWYFEAKPQRAVDVSEFSAAVVPQGTSQDLIQKLKDKGLTVKEYDSDVEGDRQRAIQEVQAEQPDVLFQNSLDNDIQGRTLNYPKTGRRLVELFENADESTFLHETGHIFLLDLQALAAMGDEESIADLRTVDEWAEWHDGDAAKYKNTPWAKEFANREKAIKEAKKSGNQEEEERLLKEWKQERFARAFEIYLYEGKAPSKGLRKVFEDFVTFLKQIYNVFTTDGARASEQVEGVMSRLMATDEEIEAASLDERYENFTAAGGEKLLEEDAKETFDRWHAEAKQEAKDKLRTIVMRDLKKRAMDKREKLLSEERANKEEELSNQPVYLARQAIQESGIKDAWKAYFPTKEEWEAADAAAPTMEEALDAYVKDVAMVYDAEQINNDFSEETIEAAMSEAPYHERLVDLERQAFASKAALVDNMSRNARQSMESVGKMIDNLPDDGSPADNAEMQDAVTTLKVSTRWSREELQDINKLAASKSKEEARKNFEALRKATEGRKVGLSDLREANRGRIESLRKQAKETIARQTLAQATQIQTHRQEERDAAREAQKQAKKQNWTEAARAKERELFASLMATEAKKTRERMDSLLKKIRRQINAKTKLPKDERYWHQHLAYLLRITDKDAEQPAGLESIQSLAISMGQGLDVVTDEDGQSDLLALMMKLSDPNVNRDGYHGMTLDEFEDAADVLTALYVTGRDKFNLKTVKGKTIQDVVDEILKDGTSYNGAKVQRSTITGNPNRGGVFWNEMLARIPGAGDTLAQYAQRYGLSLTKPEELINLLGQKAHRYIYDTYDRAAEQEASMTADFVSSMQSILSKHYTPKELRNWQARVYTLNGQSMSKENVLAMAMNMGNDINMDRLIMGIGVDAATVERFLTENMTEKDWLFCQDVWDLLSTYWPDTVRVEMELNGTRLKPQTARAFKVQSKDAKGNAVMVDLRGGYYPIKYDPKLSTKAGEQAENALAQSGMSGAMVLGMGRGFTKDRAAKGAVVDRPLLLSLSVIPEHCGEAIHNITTRIAARDVYRMINDNTFRQYVESTLGLEAYKVLRTWATDVWKVKTEQGNGAESFANQPIRTLRQNSGIAIMGYRMWPTIENLTNFFPMMDALGAAETISAINDYCSNYKEFNELIAKSMFMKERTERMERDMKGQRDMFNKRNAISEWLVEHAYVPITFTDLFASKPLWARAYKNAFPTEMENLRKENEENAATFEARRAEFDSLNAEVIDMRNRRTAIQEELRRRDLQQPVLAETEFTRMSRTELRDEIKDIDRKISEKGREVFVAGEKMQRASQLVIRTEKEMLDEAEHRAILTADKAVREVIGSGDVKDQSEVQRSRNELIKAASMFYSYFNTQANAIIQAHWRGKWQGGPGYNFLPLAKAIVYRFMLTAALSTAMRWFFFSEGNDDKDKYKKDKEGNKIEVPVLDRVLKQYAKNMLSTSIGGLWGVREVGNWAINYLIDGQVYGGGARFDGMYGSFVNQILKEGELILKKHERDEKAREDEEKRRAKYDKMTPAQKKRFREEQKYRKPPNTISYADILRGAGEIGTRLTAGRFGITDPIADAVLGTMQYIFDSDGRYDASLRNMMWSAFWTKKPVKRKPPEKPEKPKKKGR